MKSKSSWVLFTAALGLGMGAFAGGVVACKPRTFNMQKNASSGAASNAGMRAGWSSHPTSALFEKNAPTNLVEAAKIADTFLLAEAKGDDPGVDASPAAAEILSARHQQDLLRLVRDAENKDYLRHVLAMAKLSAPNLDAGLDPEVALEAVFRCGVADTDKGKLNVYKSLLKPVGEPGADTVKSERLFNTVRGLSRDRASAVLGEVLAASGFAGLWLLNPDTSVSNDALRAHFAAKPILANWMHELPGVADALELHANGVYGDAALREILSIALFHNGPDAGYWNKVTTVFLPDDTFGAGAAALAELYAGTVYESLAKSTRSGKPVAYPLPTTYLSLVHVVLDRLSQGTAGGVHKIWHEIKVFTPPAKMVEELLVVNQAGTLEQLAALKTHLQNPRVQSATPAPGKLLPAQVESLVALVEAASARVRALQDVLSKSVEITKRDAKTNAPTEATLRLPDGVKTIDASVDAPTALAWILALLDSEESDTANGEPFRTTFAAAHKASPKPLPR